MTEFAVGQEVTWTGRAHLFAREVRIAAIRNSYLEIFGQTPDDGQTVYDIADPVIGGIVYGIPADQLAGAS